MRNPRWIWSRRGRLSAVPQAAPRWVCGCSVFWFTGNASALPWDGMSHGASVSIGLSLLPEILFKVSLIISIMILIFTTVRLRFIVWNTSLSSRNTPALAWPWVTSSGSKLDASCPPFPLGGHSERGRWCVLHSRQLHTYWAFLMGCVTVVGWILDPFSEKEYPYDCSQTIVLGHRTFKRSGYLGKQDWVWGSLITLFKWKVWN